MSTIVFKIAVLLAFATLGAGCTMHVPPLQRDEHYPAQWPDISSLGLECKDLDGAYANEGIVAAAGVEQQTILLSSVILRGGTTRESKPLKEAKALSLKVATQNKDSQQTTLATLEVNVYGQQYNSAKLQGFCVKQAFAIPAVSGSSGGLPYIGFFAEQRNVWLNKANDGSLIAKVWDIDVGLVLVVPYHHQDYVWARFQRIGD